MDKTHDLDYIERASCLDAPEKMGASSDDVIGYETNFDELPKGYYTSKFFLGSMLATSLGLWAGTCAFGYIAPVLGTINADLGPDPRYTWISLVYNAALAVALGPVGRLSDIFGRRYWFIGGGILACVGTVVCATATSIPVLIGGNVLLGLASATQLCFHFVMGYVGNACLYFFTFPSSLGPSIAYNFVENYPSVGWRGLYWFLLGINGAALACWVLFYFPPSFSKKHDGEENASISYWVKNFDYVGTFLFAGGFVAFLLGLSWGGAVYPWTHAAPIAGITIGGATLAAFVLWEIYAPIKESLVPMHLFKNIEWVSAVILLGLGAGVYYAFSIIWPMQAAVMYSDGKDLQYLGGISNIIGIGMTSGQITGGFVAARIGKTKLQCMCVFLVGGIFMACAALATPDAKALAVSVIFLGCFWIGWNESICLSNATICVHDQREIGVAGGMAGSIRAAICAILVAVYTTTLTNRLGTTIPKRVPPAVIEAGLPPSSVEAFMAAVAAGTTDAFQSVPGITDQIIATGVRAYKFANYDAFRTVYLTTIAFSGVAVVLTFFAPNTEKFMTGKVVATLNNEGGLDARKTGVEEEA
ncbi:hypothetical protein QQX98_011779 [Neonectria punicea]|uniref:Major facilitator superfamily (MFS) profile domain-containing protein n=1 Tax=Neonectria punicea TaxID=979145 RepID=A0ABR1GL00_9HYPO